MFIISTAVNGNVITLIINRIFTVARKNGDVISHILNAVCTFTGTYRNIRAIAIDCVIAGGRRYCYVSAISRNVINAVSAVNLNVFAVITF